MPKIHTSPALLQLPFSHGPRGTLSCYLDITPFWNSQCFRFRCLRSRLCASSLDVTPYTGSSHSTLWTVSVITLPSCPQEGTFHYPLPRALHTPSSSPTFLPRHISAESGAQVTWGRTRGLPTGADSSRCTPTGGGRHLISCILYCPPVPDSLIHGLIRGLPGNTCTSDIMLPCVSSPYK